MPPHFVKVIGELDRLVLTQTVARLELILEVDAIVRVLGVSVVHKLIIGNQITQRTHGIGVQVVVGRVSQWVVRQEVHVDAIIVRREWCDVGLLKQVVRRL